MIARGCLLAAVVVSAACAAPPATQAPEPPVRQYVQPRTAADTTLPPFSAAVLANNTLYLAGKIGLVPGQQVVPPTAEEEAQLVLNDVKTTLEEAGMTMDDLVSVQVFASNTADYDAFNKVYRTYFTREYPARAFIGAGPLLYNARFEVQGIAVKR